MNLQHFIAKIVTYVLCSIENLAYLKWLWDWLEPEAKLLKDFWGGYQCYPSTKTYDKLLKAGDFIRGFKSVYQTAINTAAVLAIGSYGGDPVSCTKPLGHHILLCHKAFRSPSQTYISLLSKMVDFYQDNGSFLAAQQTQERLLVALTKDIRRNGTPDGTAGAIQRLVEFYNESRNRLRVIASRLGLDVEICLRVVPLLHQAASQNNDALISTVLSELGRDDNLEVLDFLGRTAVHYAVERHGVEILRCLFQGKGYQTIETIWIVLRFKLRQCKVV